jgi:ABC-2 type transport system permease protein
MMQYWKVFLSMLRYTSQRVLLDRWNVFVWILVSLGWSLFTVFFYEVVFMHTTMIAGWSKNDVYIFLASYMIVDTFTWAFFWRNMQLYVESIYDGTLDTVLVQPIDPQFRLSMRHFGITNLPRMIIGLFFLWKYAPAVSLTQIALFWLMIFVGIGIIYSVWFFTATFTFWFGKMESVIEIVPVLRRIWSMPADVYTGPISAILTIIVPLGLIATTPARFLLREYRWDEVALLFIFAFLSFMVSRWFFHFSIKRYAGVGS